MKKTLLLLSFFFLVSCAPKAIETPVTLATVNVCYGALSGTQAVAWYAYEKGLFRKYGLQVNLQAMTGGTTGITSLLSGNMDICQLTAIPVVNAAAAHQDVVMIAGLINTVSGSLMAQPEITSADLLRGKIIGIDQGSSAETATILALQALNLDPERDVVLLTIGGQPERTAALEARKVDATFITPPLTVEMRKKGYVEVFNVTTAKIPYQGTGIVTTRKYMAAHCSVMTNFMKAILEAIVRIKGDPDGSKAVVAKYMSLDPVADADALQETYNAILLGTLENVPYPTMKGIQVVIDVAVKGGNEDAALIKPQDIVDTTILDELKNSGFISGLK